MSIIDMDHLLILVIDRSWSTLVIYKCYRQLWSIDRNRPIVIDTCHRPIEIETCDRLIVVGTCDRTFDRSLSLYIDDRHLWSKLGIDQLWSTSMIDWSWSTFVINQLISYRLSANITSFPIVISNQLFFSIKYALTRYYADNPSTIWSQ